MNLSCACRLFFCLFVSVFIFTLNAFAQTGVPRFETAPCAVQIPKNEKVECGYLVVREDRSAKNNKTIRLPIIILKSENPNPQPDPVLRTLGGPGGSSLRMVSGRRFSPWLKSRDMIIFEQRGTRYAQPALQCPEVDEANINSAKQNLDSKTARQNELKAVGACRERLVKQGVNLAAYNSAESAADIEDLRRALKIEKINLYGVSYSARLMLNAMRDFPNGIRSVVIESTLPLEVNYDEVGVDFVKRSLDLLFAKCSSDADCKQAYPNLENDFYALVRQANSKPISINVKETNINLTGNNIIEWLADYYLSSDGATIATAPAQIYELTKGNYAPLKDYAESKLSPSFYSWGMRFSVWCREEIPFENMKKISAQETLYPNLQGYVVQNLPSACGVWNIPAAKKIENQPVKSDIPTMILAGEYDAYTPPEWGKTTAKHLKNSFFFEVPWVGHGPGFNSPLCLNEMVAEFFENPQTAPKSDCLDKIARYFKFKIGN